MVTSLALGKVVLHAPSQIVHLPHSGLQRHHVLVRLRLQLGQLRLERVHVLAHLLNQARLAAARPYNDIADCMLEHEHLVLVMRSDAKSLSTPRGEVALAAHRAERVARGEQMLTLARVHVHVDRDGCRVVESGRFLSEGESTQVVCGAKRGPENTECLTDTETPIRREESSRIWDA